MKTRVWLMSLAAVLMLTLTGCGQSSVLPGLLDNDAAPVSAGGGGGVVSAQGQFFTEGVVVVGTGTANSEPEVAMITFGVELRGDDPAALVEEGTSIMDEATAAVRGIGIAADDMRTTGYNLWVETVYDPERGVPTGEVVYHFSHFVRATLRDLDRVGELLAEVVDAGANTISEVSFTVEEPHALVEEARRLALEDAQTKAEAIATALGISIGKPILVTETGGGYPAPMEGVGGGGMVEVVPVISPGSFSVSASIQVVYEIR
jgi:uncharacterized protein YggE